MSMSPLQKRRTIGFLAGWQFYRTATNLSYLAPILEGINKAAHDLNCHLLLGCGIGPSASHTDPFRPAWSYPSPEQDFVPIGAWNTDGLIVTAPLHSLERSNDIRKIRDAGHPVLFVGSGENGPTLMVNNSQGILDALEHLVRHGHTRIAFIAGTQTDSYGDSGARLQAYQQGCIHFGVSQDARLIAYGRHVFHGGYTAMQDIISSGVPFTAVLASNDESALGAMQALQERGYHVPQDVAVIGFDDRPEGMVQTPGLSSIRVPLFNMGYQAVDLMLRHLEGEQTLQEKTEIPVHLVLRESCGCTEAAFNISVPIQQNDLWPADKTTADLTDIISTLVMTQSYHLTPHEIAAFSTQLVDAFLISLNDQRPDFISTLTAILNTITSSDDIHAWLHALLVLENEFAAGRPLSAQAQPLLNNAKRIVNTTLWKRHQQYVADERWISSRMSLLTNDLLMALDEQHIYHALSKHLPEMHIHRALLGLFETQADDMKHVILHDPLDANPQFLRISTEQFPPPHLMRQDTPLILMVIPLLDQSGQIGFMAFEADYLDLYGSIVQQVGGALNTVRLYRQATEAYQAAENANRTKSRLLSTISHEMRTPLNLIVGLSGMLLQHDQPFVSDDLRKNAQHIQTYSQHLGRLVKDMTDLATSDAGQLYLDLNYVDLGQVIRIVAESCCQLAKDKGLAWETHITSREAWVWGDETRLRQVILNLVHNAIKFTSQGKISLALDVGADSITIGVQDTGLGIAREDQQLIFDEFQQSRRSVAQGYGGLGLGLAISKRLIEMHDGSISVQSSGVEGEGALFTFTIPMVTKLSSPPMPLDEQPTLVPNQEQIDTLTFLVVDDEPNTLEMYCQLLQTYSPTACTLKARNGLEALEILHQTVVNLILLDLQMPQMDGFQTLAALRQMEELAKIPVLVVSAKHLTSSDMMLLQQGVTAVLGKGLFTVEEILVHIRAALEHKRKLSGESQRLIRSAMAYIHEHFAHPISRRDLAQHLGMTEDHLTFCFRQELGTTPIAYLQRYRISQSKRLLKESQQSITEIAYSVGFSDSGYFSRIFHREVGVSPQEFRRSRAS
jgi:signal transduction histidine kinase/DNA-binding LacI/PurR family transcriptional regulator/AraC-like DNA-binding protein